jgi:TetR/AcrR family transcriptional regulator, transcriptional repressor of aconitase
VAHLYALQGATASRSEAALLTATKEIISTQGIKNLAMIDIADLSQVSRATLYNHFRDKDAVLYSLLSREIITLFKGAPSNPTELLEYFSCAISADSALAGMRAHDRGILTTMLLRSDDKIWHAIDAFFINALGSDVKAGIAISWLLGQVLQPLSPDQSKAQAAQLLHAHL